MRLSKMVMLFLLIVSQSITAHADSTVRIAVLKYGTVSWVLDVIKRHGFDKQEGIHLEITPLAGTLATKVALQAGAADIIVSDWLWVSRQRRSGTDYVFRAYSTAVGAVMVPKDSPIKSLADLKGAKIGVAGGPLDKSWLLLTAFAQKHVGLDLRKETDQVFGAPPLLAQKARQGELDAVLNFWHYCARLEAAGFRRVKGVQDAAKGLGIVSEIPMIGYVFSRSWANKNPKLISAFLRATDKANELLKKSDQEWQRLRPLMRVKDDRTWQVLRDRFRQGIPRKDAPETERDIGILFKILAELGGKKLVGVGKELAPGTFWDKPAIRKP
ncbi:hypothetical protein MnTg02_01717 [bacterium MnTg02]|nr:hypothetical protein MnTg02_01717 [bacterium MnTg02]